MDKTGTGEAAEGGGRLWGGKSRAGHAAGEAGAPAGDRPRIG